MIAVPSNLAHASIGDAYTVSRIEAPQHAPEWANLLQDIGFLPGEHVTVMTRAVPGGDPLVVRVGLSTFALRMAEAACIHICPTAKA